MTVSARSCAPTRLHRLCPTGLPVAVGAVGLLSAVGLLMVLIGTCYGQQAFQQSPQTQTSPKNELTDGLLDLLKDDNVPTTSEKADLMPADVGLALENVGEQSDNPLAAVQQSMLIAAGYLKQGAIGKDTRKIQADIVGRLDDLIAQLDQAPRGQPEPQQRSQSETEQSPAEAQNSARAQSPTQAQSNEEDAVGQSKPGGNRPGAQSDQVADTQVELSDPRALQESVWGQLPERVRSQMQSRMVEQFLPAYRSEIEAYFRALIKN